jgi:hypothetical protein
MKRFLPMFFRSGVIVFRAVKLHSSRAGAEPSLRVRLHARAAPI